MPHGEMPICHRAIYNQNHGAMPHGEMPYVTRAIYNQNHGAMPHGEMPYVTVPYTIKIMAPCHMAPCHTELGSAHAERIFWLFCQDMLDARSRGTWRVRLILSAHHLAKIGVEGFESLRPLQKSQPLNLASFEAVLAIPSKRIASNRCKVLLKNT